MEEGMGDGSANNLPDCFAQYFLVAIFFGGDFFTAAIKKRWQYGKTHEFFDILW